MGTNKESFEKEIKTDIQKRNGCTVPINGCLMLIILSALATIAVKECKRQDLRLKKDQATYQQYMDSINRIKNDTIRYHEAKNR